MNTEPVRLLRSMTTFEYDTVPRDRVPGGYVRVHVIDRGEFVAPPDLLQNLSSTVRHGPFPAAARDDLRRFQRAFAGAYTRTLEEWEEGFRRDVIPWREMAWWDVAAAAVERFTAHLPGDEAAADLERMYVARAVLFLAKSPPVGAVRFQPVGTVPAARVREISAFLSRPDAAAAFRAAVDKYRRVLRPVVLATPFPAEAPFHALFDDRGGFNLSARFDTQEFLEAADVVYARDVGTGAQVLVYGRDLEDRVAAGEDVAEYRTATVALDAGSDEFSVLLALLKAVKGRHEYRPEP